MSSDELNSEAVFDIIKNWLKEDDLLVKEHKHPQALRIMEIMLGPNARGNIIVPVAKQNRLVISHGLKVAPEHIEALSELDNDNFEEFWFKMFTTLITLGVDFDTQKEGKTVKFVGINAEIMFEEILLNEGAISKQLFYEKLAMVRKASLFVIHIIQYYSGTYSKFLALD